MKQEYLNFPCGQLSLEGILHLPQGSGPFAAVVVCHPHPLYGGDMHNNVVVAVCRALCQRGIAAFRFNTRGTGRSQGSFGGGSAEREDVEAALSFIASREEIDANRMGLCGYSFGAIPSFSAVPSQEQLQAIAAISPPLGLSHLEGFKGFPKAKLIISGSRDNFTSQQALQGFCEGLAEPKQCQVIPGADHFWWGYEEELGEKVASFFVAALGS